MATELPLKRSKMIHSLSTRYFLKPGKVNNQGKATIYVRISVDGKRSELSTGLKILPSQWDNIKHTAKGKTADAKNINERINTLQAKIQKQYNILDSQDQTITAIDIANLVSGKLVKRHTILEAYTAHNDDFKLRVGKDFTHSTYKRHLVSYNKVQSFIKYKYRKPDLYLEELNYNFITSFDLYLKTQDSNAHNTATKHITNLKKVITQARANEWMTNDPFSRYKASYKETNREPLTKAELDTLMEKEFSNERLDKVRDVFVFSCFSGLAFSDMEKLTPNDISIDENGQKWIIIYRKKTNTRSPIFLLDEAIDIINKYADSPETKIKGTLLPVSTNQRMNEYLKEIADVCGINMVLTSHIGRYTFATTVTLANGVPLETVSKMLGHKNLDMTIAYSKVQDSKIAKDMSSLKATLSNTDNQKKEAS